jgi:N-methylhydantoinase B
MFSFFGGGLGASPGSDGLSHANNPISTATIPPVEILEAMYPVLFTQWALRPDSAGAGAYRGGLGAIYEIEMLQDASVSLLGERGKRAPFGIAGGEAAALNRFAWSTQDGWKTAPMVSKVTDIALAAGHRLRLETPGGGGFGYRKNRDSAARLRDERLGYVAAP